MNCEGTSYRTFLKEMLVKRIADNPSYSLRAMARQMGIAPSMLSAVLKAKKNLSTAKAFEIAKNLKLNDSDTDYFCLLVDYDRATDPELKEKFLTKLQQFEGREKIVNLEISLFKVISEWYHFPILEMTHIKSFEFTPANISRSLSISIMEAELAIDRLLSLDLLAVDENDKYYKTEGRMMVTSSVPHKALNKYHEQMLKKATVATHKQTTNERFTGSETFPFSKKHLGKAEEIINRCFDELLALSEDEGETSSKEDIYHAGIQLFRLNNIEGKNEKTI